MDRFIRCSFRFYTDSVVLTDYDNIKDTVPEHSWKASLSFSDGQDLLRIIPMNWDRCVGAFFVVVRVVLVFVEGKLSICARVDTQFDWIRGLLIRPLLVGPHGNNRPCADVEWHAIERSGGINHPATID